MYSFYRKNKKNIPIVNFFVSSFGLLLQLNTIYKDSNKKQATIYKTQAIK
jgi:hypothetical protein